MPDETKKTDDSAAAGTVAATEEGAAVEEEDTGDASISSDEDVVAEGTADSEVIPVEDGTQQGTIEDSSADEDASISTGSEAIVASDSEGDDDTGEAPEESDPQPEELPVPEAPESPVSTARVFDPRTAFVRDNVSTLDPLKGSGRPTEDEEQELLEVRRGTLEPPDISFGTGAGADAASRVSAPPPTQSPRDILPMSTGVPVSPHVDESSLDATRFGRLQEDPTDVWIGDTGIDGPTEIPVGGAEVEGDSDDGGLPPEPEPPPAEEPPDPSFGAGSSLASTEPDVSDEARSGVEPDPFALPQALPEIYIDSPEEPTEVSIDGTPLEPPPPPADEPPDPDA